MRVLIGEDDMPTAAFIAGGLEALGFETVQLADGGLISERLSDETFDLVILDRMLPTLDGLSIVKEVRQRGLRTPIFLLTALGQIDDRVRGLDAGADDYIVKPFAMAELSARVASVFRRLAADPALPSLTVGPLTLDLLHRELQFHGKPIALQPRESRILEQLMRNPGRIVTRTMLLETIWNFHFDPQTNLVETHMSRLRTKLAIAGADRLIETVRGEGYRLRTEDDA